jgi:predicted RND superfamily exporter protein
MAALLPNILPAAVVLGVMGLVGIRMNLGGALIAAVSVGLSVDSSLHYLIRYKRELAAGRSQRQALQACQSDVGIAMLISTFALVLGFGSLATSSFLPTVVFGTTAALTMLGGLLGNLWLLPMLLAGDRRAADA